MANNIKYRFKSGENVSIAFDSKGYIVEAKGFSFLLWSSNPNIDKALVGKHVDELSHMLKKNGTHPDVYPKFETQVHIELLKMIQNASH